MLLLLVVVYLQSSSLGGGERKEEGDCYAGYSPITDAVCYAVAAVVVVVAAAIVIAANAVIVGRVLHLKILSRKRIPKQNSRKYMVLIRQLTVQLLKTERGQIINVALAAPFGTGLATSSLFGLIVGLASSLLSSSSISVISGMLFDVLGWEISIQMGF